MDEVVAVIIPNNQVVSADVVESVQIISANIVTNDYIVSATVEGVSQEVIATVNSTAQTVVAVISEFAASASVEHIELELKMTSLLNRYKEFTYNVGGYITLQEVWNSSSKTTKYYNINYTYNSGDLVNIEVERVSDGFTYNKEFTYNVNGDLISINIT